MPNLRVGIVYALNIGPMEENVDFIALEESWVTEQLIEELKQHPTDLFVWTLNDDRSCKPLSKKCQRRHHRPPRRRPRAKNAAKRKPIFLTTHPESTAIYLLIWGEYPRTKGNTRGEEANTRERRGNTRGEEVNTRERREILAERKRIPANEERILAEAKAQAIKILGQIVTFFM